MSLLAEAEIRDALNLGDICIDPLKEESLKAASYDARLGNRAIITKSLSLDELRGKVERGDVPELDVEKERSITIPGGAFALVTSRERIKTTGSYVGHIGMKTYYIRKGLMLLSGLQIDPWWDGVLVLGLANLSPRSITAEFEDDLCTIEFHRLAQSVEQKDPSLYMAEQREGKIPRSDKDYLRTIETMSVSDLTNALVSLSRSVEGLAAQFNYFWVGIAVMIAMAALSIILAAVK